MADDTDGDHGDSATAQVDEGADASLADGVDGGHGEADADDAISEEDERWLLKQGLWMLVAFVGVLVWFGITWWRVWHAPYWDFQDLRERGMHAEGWVVSHGYEGSGRSADYVYALEAHVDGRVLARRWDHPLSRGDNPEGCLRTAGRERHHHPNPVLSDEEMRAEAASLCDSNAHKYLPWPIEVLYLPEEPDAYMPAEGPIHVWPYFVAALPPSGLVFAGIWLLVSVLRDDDEV